MNPTLHHLVIPKAVVGLDPGAPIYLSADGWVGVTYMGSSGAAFALVPAGTLTLTLGDARNAPTADIEMQASRLLLAPRGPRQLG